MHELQILLLLDPRLACRCVAQAGTFRPSPPAWTRSLNGVAVTSQILCISITLNKGYYVLFIWLSVAMCIIHDLRGDVNREDGENTGKEWGIREGGGGRRRGELNVPGGSMGMTKAHGAVRFWGSGAFDQNF